jgi:hypothetical protein
MDSPVCFTSKVSPEHPDSSSGALKARAATPRIIAGLCRRRTVIFVSSTANPSPAFAFIRSPCSNYQFR